MFKRFLQIPWLPYAPIWLAPFVLMAPAWLAGRAIFWGTPILQFVPWSAWAAQILASGHLPLWNPLLGMGAPLLANYQSALLYPPNWLLLLLGILGGAPLLAWGQAVLIALHLAWAGLGMAKLARRLGLGRLPEMVSGLAFGLSGYLVGRAGFLSINAAVAWLPWILLGILEAAFHDGTRQGTTGRQRFHFPFLLAFSLGMQLLAGHAQTTWYTLILAGMWAVLWGVMGSSRRLPASLSRSSSDAAIFTGQPGINLREVFRPLAMLSIASLAAAAMAAGQLLPTVEYLLHSQRESGLDLDFALGYSFSPWHFLTLALPDFFGNPGRGNYVGYANYWESAVYIGLLPLLLALSAVVSALRRRPDLGDQTPPEREPGTITGPERPLILFLVGVTIVSFILSLGKNTPLYPWLYLHVPTFGMFLGPARWSLWAEFALALLAGYGVQGWRRPQGKGLYWIRLGTAGAFAATAGALLAGHFSSQADQAQSAAAAVAGIWAAGVGILSLTGPRQNPDQHPRWSWAVVLLVCADLLFAHFPLNPAETLDLYHSPSPGSEAIRQRLDGGRLFINTDDEYEIKFERFFRFNTYDLGEDWRNLRQVYLPNTAMLDGLPSANNFDPLLPARYARWMKYLSGASPSSLGRLIPRMNVRLVEKVDQAQTGGVGFTEVQPLGRARWVPCAILAYSPEEVWQKVTSQDSTLDYAQTFVILEEMPGEEKTNCDPQATGQAQIVLDTPNRLEIHVKAPSNGWLIIADMWYPGWMAQVDGISTPVLHADYLFRAAAVPAGEHQIVFQYRPLSFSIGVFVSLLALGAVFLMRFLLWT